MANACAFDCTQHGAGQSIVLAERGRSRHRIGRRDPSQRSCAFSALADGGSYAFYTWFGNLLSNVAGQHQTTIPHGQLCGPGANFKAFNAVSAALPASCLLLPGTGRSTPPPPWS